MAKLGTAFVDVRSRNSTKKGLKKIRREMGSAIKSLAKAAVIPIAIGTGAAIAGLSKAIDKFAEFETALVNISKVSSESLSTVREMVREIPAEYGTATEAAKAYYEVLSAGVIDPIAKMETLKTALVLSKTASLEAGKAVKGLTSVMDAFGVSSITAGDSLQQMEKIGKTSVGNLIPIIGEISGSASLVGLSLDEMGASFGRVTLQAGSTEKAATQFKALMNSLIAPTGEMKDLLFEYGGAQGAIKEIGFEEVLKKISDAAGGNAESLKKLLGSTESVLAASALFSDGLKGMGDNMDAMKNKTGVLDKAWVAYQGTLKGLWTTFKNTIGNQLIWIGEKLAPAIESLIGTVGDWLEKNQELITSKFGGWIEKITGFMKDRLIPAIGNIVTEINKWFGENKNIIGQKLDVTITAIADSTIMLVENLNLLILPLKIIGQAFKWLGGDIAKTMIAVDKYIISVEKLVKFFKWITLQDAAKMVIEFIGKGSTEKPLGEKIEEIESKMDSLQDHIDHMETRLLVDFFGDDKGGPKRLSSAIKSAEDEMTRLSDEINFMESIFTIDIDNTPAIKALDEVKAEINSVSALAERNALIMSGVGIRQRSAASRSGTQALLSAGIGFTGQPLGTTRPKPTHQQDIMSIINRQQVKTDRPWWESGGGLTVNFNSTVQTGNDAAMRDAAKTFSRALKDQGIRIN